MADRGRAEESVWRASEVASKKSDTWDPPRSRFRHRLQSFLLEPPPSLGPRLAALLREYTTISVYKRSIMLSSVPRTPARKIARSVPRFAPTLAVQRQQHAQRTLHALTARSSVPRATSVLSAGLPDSRVLGQKRWYFHCSDVHSVGQHYSKRAKLCRWHLSRMGYIYDTALNCF